MLRRSLRTILQAFPGVVVVSEAITGEDAVIGVGTLQPDIVLMDVNIPLLDGIAATRLIKMKYPHVSVVGLTCHTPGDLLLKSMTTAGAFEVVQKEEALHLYQVMQRAVTSSSPTQGRPTRTDQPRNGASLS